MDSDFLKYGDSILIQSQEFEGCMVTFGFLETHCYMQQLPGSDLRKALNSRCMVFKVLPKLNYECLLEFHRLKTAIRQKSGGGQVQLQQEDLDLIESLQQKMESEKELNERTINQRNGTKVVYGQEVQFMHVSSQMLLKGKRETAEGDRSCYLLELSETGSVGVHFKLLPRYKYRQEGDFVTYSDFLLISNVKLGLFLHISDKPIQSSRDPSSTRVNSSHCADVAPCALTFAVLFEVNISTQKSVLRIVCFGSILDDQKHIHGGAVVRLKHTEIGGLMCSEGIDFSKDGLADVYVRKYKGEDRLERSSAHSCFVVEAEVDKNVGQTCTWKSEGRPTLYRLRHLTTRRIITVAQDRDGELISLAKHPHEEESPSDPSLFSFISTAVESTNKMRDGSIAKLRAKTSGKYLATLSEEWVCTENKGAGVGDDPLADDTIFYMPLEIDEIVVARKKIVLSADSQIEDAYQISLVPWEETSEIEFVMSAVPALKKCAAMFENGKEPERTLFVTVEKIMGKMILFCNQSENRNPYTCEGEPLGRRQKFIRELGVLDWVCSILYYPFSTGMYSLETLRKSEMMTKVCVLGYRLVRLAAKDNRINELYCAQWMGLFLFHAESTTQNDHLHPEETLTEILSDNRRLLERQIRPRIVRKFVNLLRRGRDEKYAKLIATLCTCEGDAVTRNQNTICDIITSEPEFTESMMVAIRTTSRVIEVEAREHRTWVRLESLQQFSEERDDGKVYNYFLALLDLISELAFDRNHQTESLRAYYPFGTCFACLENSDISDTIRSKFLRVMLHLHIDQGEVQPLALPNYTRIWTEVTTEDAFPFTKAKLSMHIQETKKFVYSFLCDLGGVLRAREHTRNELVKQVLLLTRFLISHGVYTSPEELTSLCRPLADLLDGSTDIVVNYTSVSSTKALTKVAKEHKLEKKGKARYEANEVNLVLNDCKRLICNILSTVMTIRLDYQLSILLGHLKEEKALWGETPGGKRRQSDSEDELIPQNDNERLRSAATGRSIFDASFHERTFAHLRKALYDPFLLVTACVDKDLITVLTDLMLYQNMDVVHESFRLLLKLFSQTKTLVSSMQNIQLLEHEEAVHILANIREKLNTLNLAAETAETWLGREISPESRAVGFSSDTNVVSTHDDVNFILSYLVELCVRRDKRPSDMSDEPEKEQQSSSFIGLRAPMTRKPPSVDTSFIFTSPRDFDSSIPLDINNDSEERIAGVLFGIGSVPSKENQRLLRNLKVYAPVLEIASHKGIITGYNRERHRCVLRHCYTFLASFCHNNPQNQELLYNSLESFIEDLDKNACASLLIQEIFMNNAGLCSKVPSKYIRMIVRQINDMPLSLEKSCLFRTLAVLVKCKDRILKANQLEVVTQLASSDMTNVLIVYTSQQDFVRLEKSLKRCVAMYSTGVKQSEVEIPVDACYLIALLDLLSICSEQWNAQAEVICQRIVSIPQLNRLFEISPLFWPLRTVLTQFFLNVYLDIEFSTHDNEKILWLNLERMSADMDYIYNNYMKSGRNYSPAIESVYFRMGDRRANIVEFALHYIYGAMIPTLVEIFMKRGTGLQTDTRSELVKSLVQQACLFHKLAIVPRHAKISEQLVRVIADIEKFKKFLRPEFVDMKEKAEGRRRSVLEFQVLQHDDGKAAAFARIVKGLVRYKPVSDAMDNEFHEFVRHLKNIEKNSSRAFSSRTIITTKEMLCAFISFLHNFESPDMDEIRLIGVKTLRKFIELDNAETTAPAAEWSPEDWKKSRILILQSQNLLVSLKAVSLIISVFTKAKDKSLKSECLLLMIALLFGGNKNAQDEFLLQMAENQNNEFLWGLRNMLMNCFEHSRDEYRVKISEAEKRLRERVSSLLESNMTEGAASEDQTVWILENLDVVVENVEDLHSQPQQMSQNVLRVFQLFCEGHNLASQKFLREQASIGIISPKSTNIVSFVGSLLGMYTKILHRGNITLGYQLLDTLSEMTQGPCRDNQRELSQPKIIDNGRDLLTSLANKTEKEVRGFDPEDDLSEEISELKSKTASFLLSLLEGEVDLEIVNRIVSTLDFKMIKERMSEVFKAFVKETFKAESSAMTLNEIDERLKKDSFGERVEEGFNLYILMNKLAGNNASAAKKLESGAFGSEDQLKAFTFFKEHVGRIEIAVEKMLQSVYFPINPICRFISQPSKDELLDTVNRDSHASKVTDLITLSIGVIEEMNHNEWLSHATWHPDMEKYLFLRDVCFALALFINLLILFFYEFTVDVNQYIDPTIRHIIRVCGAVLVAISAVCVVLWLILKGSLEVKEKWRRMVEATSRQNPPPEIITQEYLQDLTAEKTWAILLNRGPFAIEFWIGETRDFRFLSTKLLYYMISSKMLLSATTLQVLVLYTLFSALGFLDLFFYAFLLTDIVFRFPTLRNILKAITSNKTQLLMTSMLSVLVMFIYAIWGFYISPMMYYANGFGQDGWGEPLCQSLWQCFLTTIDMGPRLSGGIGDILWKFSFEDKFNWYSRFFLDLSYFLLIRIMFLNIILGTIIDSFAQMREKKKNKEWDKKNKCFICDIDRQTLDRNGGHERHISEDHSVWNYVYFLVHLKKKDPTEWNGGESYCARLLRKGDFGWVPHLRALCLREEAHEHSTDDHLLESAELKATAVSNQMKEIRKLLKD